MKKGLALFLGVLLTGLTAALPARADEYAFSRAIDKSVAAAGVGTLQVTGLNGNVHLYGDGGSSVRVHAILRARSDASLKVLDVSAERSGNAVSVKDVCPATRRLVFWSFADCDIELEVHYPRGMTVWLRSSNGNVDVQNAGAALNITNDNGNLRIDNASANVRATNKNGNVTATLAPGWHGTAIALTTHAGNVDVRVPANFAGTLNAHTRMGNVDDNARMRSGPATITASTTFGNVTVSRE